MSSPAAPEIQEPTPETPPVSPEATPAPAAEADTGQPDLPPENPPQAAADDAAATGEPSEPDSVTPNAGAITPDEWSKLSPSERKAAADLVKQLQPGEIPRIAKLVAKNHQAEQVIEAQQKEIEELRAKADAPSPVAVNHTALPPTVAKLKTTAEVQARTGEMENTVAFVNDLLDEFPNGNVQDQPDTWQVGDKTFTRSDLVHSRRNCQEELKALRVRKDDLENGQRLVTARQQMTAVIRKDFPQLEDPEHPDTKVARQLLAQDARLQSDVNGEYLALALAVGHRALQDQKAKRSAPAAARVARPAATVPAGTPHAAGSPAATRGTNGAASALAEHVKRGSRDSFAALLSARG